MTNVSSPYHTTHLMSKLIAGYTQDNEALGGVAAVELVHLSVVPGCCSSEGRHILNKNHFSSQRREAQNFTRQQFGCQLVELFHTASHGNRLRVLFCTFPPFHGQMSQRQALASSRGGSELSLQVLPVTLSVAKSTMIEVPIGCLQSHEVTH